MKILVTAFDPFGGEAINPAQEAVAALPPEIEGAQVITLTVPTEFGRSLEAALQAIDEHAPDAVVCIGQAGGRTAITPERIAINIDDARIPDNAGRWPIDEPVVPGGPAAYVATLPVKAMVQAIRGAGLSSELSNTAGTFVCNHLMYGVLHHAAVEARNAGPAYRAGFVHVPFVPEQVAERPGSPSLPLADTTRGLVAAIAAVVWHDEDVRAGLGALH